MATSLGAKATFLLLRLIRRKRIYASRQVLARESAHGDPLFLMGDSAGAGLALALAAALRDQGAQLAQRLILITPWVDVELPHPDAPAIGLRAPMLVTVGARLQGRCMRARCPPRIPPSAPFTVRCMGCRP